METFIWFIVFGLAMVALLQGAKWFNSATIQMGKALGFSSFLSGVVMLAIGTSMPELTTSIFAASRGYTQVVAADIVGSNIANILLILAIVAITAKNIEVDHNKWTRQVPLLLCSTLLLIGLLMDGSVNWMEGVIALIAYLIYSLQNQELYQSSIWDSFKSFMSPSKIDLRLIGLFGGSLLIMLAGAHFTIQAVIEISEGLRIGTSVVSGTAVAVGTSLPELVTSWIAVRQKNYDLAVGNIIGSNIFNATLVLGIPSLISSLTVSSDVISLGVPYMFSATLILIFLTHQKSWTRYEGGLMMLIYLVFLFQFLNPLLS